MNSGDCTYEVFKYGGGPSGLHIASSHVDMITPSYYLMRRGIVILREPMIRPRPEKTFAEKLSERALLVLGGTGSRHDEMAFRTQAARLLTALLRREGYRKTGVDLVRKD